MRLIFKSKLYITFALILFLGCNITEHVFQKAIPFSVLTKSYVSSVDNKVLSFQITDEILNNQPQWSPDKPPPISLNEIATVAKSELPKYNINSTDWDIQTVSIDRVKYSSNGPEKWVYIVSFRRGSEHNYINLPIGLNGQPFHGVYQR